MTRSASLKNFVLIPILLAIALPGQAGVTKEWTQYRGPDTLGAAEADGLFAAADLGLRVTWKTELGSGYSRVIIAGGRAITMFSDGESDFLAAFEETTGKELWRYRVSDLSRGFDGSHDGPISTPLIAGKNVIGLSTQGRLFAVETDTGKEIWSVDLAATFKAAKPYYGFASSPVLAEGMVILQVAAEGSAISGFDAGTGERKWTAGEDTIQYQTPVILREGGRTTVVAAGMKNLYGLDPATGEIRWQFEHGGSGADFGAGKITAVPAGDGRLFLAYKNDEVKMVQLIRKDELTVPETLWETRNIRHSYDTAVYHDGHLYSFSSRFLICLDAATGEARWRSREPGDGFLTLVDDHLVIATKDGTLHVVEATPEGYRETASVSVFDDHAWAAPSIANGHVFLRSLSELARISIGKGKTVANARHEPPAGFESTSFGKFLARVETAEDKKSVVDEYLGSVRSFPIVDDTGWVHFVYRGPAEDVALGGDLTETGWEERMHRVEGTDLFRYSTRLEPGARASYVFLADYQQILDPRNARKTLTSSMAEDLELNFGGGTTMEMSWFSMPEWKEPTFLAADAKRKGRLEQHDLSSKIIEADIPIQVYLPADYGESTEHYPVVYVHGGDEALEHGQWPRALDHLIGKQVAPLIAVFIGRFPARGQQYTQIFTGEILPFMDETFRTIPEASGRANYGNANGAVTAFFATFGNPELFGKLATQSAFLFDYALGPLQGMIQPSAETPVAVYIDWGKYDLRSSRENWNLAVLNRKMYDFLVDRGYSPGGGEAAEGAGWPSWRNRTGEVLAYLFPKGE